MGQCLTKENENNPLHLNPLTFHSRFSHVTEEIFAQLDNKSLKNCREVSRSWQKCIDHKKISWKRIVEIPKSREAVQIMILSVYSSSHTRFVPRKNIRLIWKQNIRSEKTYFFPCYTISSIRLI